MWDPSLAHNKVWEDGIATTGGFTGLGQVVASITQFVRRRPLHNSLSDHAYDSYNRIPDVQSIPYVFIIWPLLPWVKRLTRISCCPLELPPSKNHPPGQQCSARQPSHSGFCSVSLSWSSGELQVTVSIIFLPMIRAPMIFAHKYQSFSQTKMEKSGNS